MHDYNIGNPEYDNKKCKFCNNSIMYPDWLRQQGKPPYTTIHKCSKDPNSTKYDKKISEIKIETGHHKS